MVKVEIETLPLLSEAEIRAGLRAFLETRNNYASQGRHGMAGIFNALLCALKDERSRRENLFREYEREISGTEEARWED